MHAYMHTYIYIYIYIYTVRERDYTNAMSLSFALTWKCKSVTDAKCIPSEESKDQHPCPVRCAGGACHITRERAALQAHAALEGGLIC
jgi:hypothetical protein